MGAYRIIKKKDEIEFPITKAFLLLYFIGVVLTPFLIQVRLFWVIFIYFFILSIVSLFIRFLNFSTIEKLKGKYEGTIEFFSDRIQVKSEIYELSDIINISLYTSDYAGRRNFLFHTLDPDLSNGTNNHIEILLKSQERIRVYFQLHTSKQFLENKDYLINYYKKGKISYLKLIDTLQIKKYEEIQKFKKELNT